MEQKLTIFAVPDAGHDAKVQLLAVPYDATTSYRPGASLGPKAIFEASSQVDLYDFDVGSPHEAGLHMVPISADITMRNQVARAAVKRIRMMQGKGIPPIQADLDFVNEAWDKNNAYAYTWAKSVLEKEQIPVLIGGDHSTPFGAIKACAEHIEGGIGILHLDAHCDLRDAYEGFRGSHASIMYNVAKEIPQVTRLVQVGIRDYCLEEFEVVQSSEGRIVAFFDAKLREARLKGLWYEQCDKIVAELPKQVYLSFDIDGLNPTLCPNTGTPVPGGLLWDEIIVLLQAVVKSGRTIVGLDLNEVAVPADCPEDALGAVWDANVGARLLYKMIGFTLQSLK